MSRTIPGHPSTAPAQPSTPPLALRSRRWLLRRSRSTRTFPGVLALCAIAAALASCGQAAKTAAGPLSPLQVASNATAFLLSHDHIDSQPGAIVASSDGNLWLTLRTDGTIGSITPNGVFTRYTLPTAGPLLTGITPGHDGTIWIADMRAGTIWRLAPGTGATKGYAVPGDHVQGSGVSVPDNGTLCSNLQGATTGRDGAIWFSDSDSDRIGRLDPTTGKMTLFPLPQGDTPCDLTAGSDGTLWVSLENQQSFVPGGNIWIARVEPTTGVVRVFSIPHVVDFTDPPGSVPPRSLTPGPNGNIWFVINNSDSHQLVGYMTPSGLIQEFTTHNSPQAITSGPDGNLWFFDLSGSLERATPAGVITQFPLLSDYAVVDEGGIAAGPDHKLWALYVTREPLANKIEYETFAVRISVASWA